jgi:hypothetical protein
MGTNGYASLTLVDNGGSSIVVPGQAVQLVLGCASAGTVNQIIATRSPQTLSTNFNWGPLPEASSLTCLGGGTVLACRVPTVTAGAKTAVTFTGTGSSVITVTGTPNDTYYVKVTAAQGGTIGTGPINLTISLDAGRTSSPLVALGTALTYTIPGTGLTLNFAAGTLVTGDVATFSTTEPLWNAAGITAALQAYAASPYAQNPIGSIHIVGGSTAGGVPGADASTIGAYLESMATSIGQPLYNAAILSARDAAPPVAWGGAGETEQTWMTSIQTSYSAVAQKRVAACAAYWNMPSALVNPLGMSPRFRRSLAYAIAQRTVQIQPQRSWGRVKDGPLAPIVVDPVNDPVDGFIYHNDAGFAPTGLGDQRFVTTTTRAYKQGIYARTAPNMASTGAQISSWPLIEVANFASVILIQEGQNIVNDNVRQLLSGALDPRDAAVIQTKINAQLTAQMTSQQMISASSVVVDTTNNVQLTGAVNVTTTLVARGVVLQVNVTLQYNNPNQAQAA